MSGPTTASGAPVSTPSISLYRQSTLRGWWHMVTPNGRSGVVQQTDIGPAPWTGKLFDFTYTVLDDFGYSEGSFPTGATACARFLPSLRHGSHNSDVRLARKLLRDRGVRSIGTRSKYFTKQMRKTVWRFQRKKRISADGKIGPATWAKLYATRLIR